MEPRKKKVQIKTKQMYHWCVYVLWWKQSAIYQLWKLDDQHWKVIITYMYMFTEIPCFYDSTLEY